MQRHNESSAGRIVLLVLGALALAGYGVCRLSVKHEVVEVQGVVECSSLPGLAGQVCSSYHTAVGPEKFTAAAHWRQLSLSTCECSVGDHAGSMRESTQTGPLQQSPTRVQQSWHTLSLQALKADTMCQCKPAVEQNLQTQGFHQPACLFLLSCAICDTDACSGVTMECLQEDMRSSSAVSSCRPLQEGDACDEEKQLTCSQGFCGGEHTCLGSFS